MGRLPERTQLLALALLNHADDHGYFHADPAIIRGACAPFREDLATIREDLARLSAVGWVDLREHPTQGQIGYVVNWAKHQKVDHPKASKIEGYFIRENLAKTSDRLALDQGSGIRDQGVDQGGAPRTGNTDDQGLFSKTPAPPQGGVVRSKTLGDFEACHRQILVTRDDRGRATATLALFGWDACAEGMAALASTANARPHGKRRIFISELSDWLHTKFTPEAEDYLRAGLPAPGATA
jgi:hypothetical protein